MSRWERDSNDKKELEIMKLKMEHMAKMINYMESGKKWNKQGNKKQFVFATKVILILVED